MIKEAFFRILFASIMKIRKIKLGFSVMTHKSELRVVIGSGGTTNSGWIHTDYPIVDVTRKDVLQEFFKDRSVHAFLAEHVLEHLTEREAVCALDNCYDLLRTGGYFRLAVPDGFHCEKGYIDAVRPGGGGFGADGHKVLYDYQSLSLMLKNAGFHVELLEWFDEFGVFHKRDWSPNDGMIRRSTRFDERNKDNYCAYTSLIIDAIKDKY